MIYHLLCFLLKLLSFMPFRVMYILSDGLYYVSYYIIRYRRGIVRRNLTESFPEKSPAEIKATERKFYRFFMDMILESCKLATISPEEISRRMTFENMEEVNALFRQGKTVSLYLGHHCNWEWVSSIPLHVEKGTDSAQIYHKLRNKSMERLMLHIRERMGAKCVGMHQTARFANGIAKSETPYIIGFIADQSPRKRESRHFLHFLNHNTPVLTGSEKITKHYGFEAYFLHVKRTRRGYYEAVLHRLHDNPQSLPDFELTGLYFRSLEQAIMQQPETYLWTHNRFKHDDDARRQEAAEAADTCKS